MARKMAGMPGGMNMNNMLKQAQKMQKQMAETQASLAEKELEVSSGGGAITVAINGKNEITKISISEEVVDPDDIEMLEDLVLSAVNEAFRQMSEQVNSEMGKITGGLGGGLF
ncbi:MAG: YbaB/EbfC family nucleoid-associated protein [Lachnospirales bacterium]